jgi:DNA-binding NarL/FixJ family response regulator
MMELLVLDNNDINRLLCPSLTNYYLSGSSVDSAIPPGPPAAAEGMEDLSETVQDSPIRVFLLIENRLLREALDRLFRKRPDLLVVGQRGRDDISLQRLLEIQWDVLAVDFFDPKWFPSNLVAEGTRLHGRRALLIGMNGEEEQFLAAVRAGVTGYLLKDASASDVVHAVRATFKGEAVCPPRLCLILLQFIAHLTREAPFKVSEKRPDLTLRQHRLVALVAKGLTNKEIAAHLNLSEFTVRNHIHRIMKQVAVGSRREAVEAVRAHGYPMIS